MKKKGLIVDLTALLDVILIILFLVLVSNAKATKDGIQDIREENASLKQENVQLREDNKTLRENQKPTELREKEWYSIFEENFIKVDLYFPKQDSKEAPTLRVGEDLVITKPHTQPFDEWFEKEISNLQGDNILLTFSYYNDSIYLSDYEKAQSLILYMTRYSGRHIFFKEVNLGGIDK